MSDPTREPRVCRALTDGESRHLNSKGETTCNDRPNVQCGYPDCMETPAPTPTREPVYVLTDSDGGVFTQTGPRQWIRDDGMLITLSDPTREPGYEQP